MQAHLNMVLVWMQVSGVKRLSKRRPPDLVGRLSLLLPRVAVTVVMVVVVMDMAVTMVIAIVIVGVIMIVPMVLACLCGSRSCGLWPVPVALAPASRRLPGPFGPRHHGLGGSLSGAWVSNVRAGVHRGPLWGPCGLSR